MGLGYLVSVVDHLSTHLFRLARLFLVVLLNRALPFDLYLSTESLSLSSSTSSPCLVLDLSSFFCF